MKITQDLVELGKKLANEVGGNGVLSHAGYDFLREGIESMVRDLDTAAVADSLSAIDGVSGIIDLIMKIPPGYFTVASTLLGSVLIKNSHWFWAPAVAAVLMGVGRGAEINLRRYLTELDRNKGKDKVDKKKLSSIFFEAITAFGSAPNGANKKEKSFQQKLTPTKRHIYNGFKQTVLFAKVRDMVRPHGPRQPLTPANMFDSLDGWAAQVWLGLDRLEENKADALIAAIPTKMTDPADPTKRVAITFEAMRDNAGELGREIIIMALGEMGWDFQSVYARGYDLIDNAFEMVAIRQELKKFGETRLAEIKDVNPVHKGQWRQAAYSLGIFGFGFGLPTVAIVLGGAIGFTAFVAVLIMAPYIP